MTAPVHIDEGLDILERTGYLEQVCAAPPYHDPQCKKYHDFSGDAQALVGCKVLRILVSRSLRDPFQSRFMILAEATGEGFWPAGTRGRFFFDGTNFGC